MKSSGYFVTGTDTGVGKTLIATMLALGSGSSYWKPVQTGAIDGTDSEFARRWLASDCVHPEAYSLRLASSPHEAARAEDITISVKSCEEKFPKTARSVFVEGAGGALVPLNDKEFQTDLIQRLNLPVIVVCRTRLGCINHFLLTIEALKSRQITVAGFITNGDWNEETERILRTKARWLGHVPTFQNLSKSWLLASYNNLESSVWS